MMKKAIWILFVTLTLVWTGFAFLAAGLASWTSDAIASDRFADTTQYVALTSGKVTQKLTDAAGRVTEQVTATVTQAVAGEAAGEEQQPVNDSTGAATAAPTTAASTPILPPLPEWVNQLLAPEMVQSIKEWGILANSAAHVGKAKVADAANASAAIPEAARQAAIQSTTMAGDAATQVSIAAETAKSTGLQSAKTNNPIGVSVAPRLAAVVGWLVPIVWVIWGIGLILGLLLTLIAQWGVRRFLGSSPLKPVSAS